MKAERFTLSAGKMAKEARARRVAQRFAASPGSPFSRPLAKFEEPPPLIAMSRTSWVRYM